MPSHATMREWPRQGRSLTKATETAAHLLEWVNRYRVEDGNLHAATGARHRNHLAHK